MKKMVSVSLFLRIEMAYKPVLAKKILFISINTLSIGCFVYRVKVCDVLFEFQKNFQSCFV
jgi:hypothetical protein